MTSHIVIGLSGKRGSGKDTLAAQMAQYHFTRLSFAEALKERCRQDFHLTHEHTDGELKEVPTRYTRTDGNPLTPRDIMIRCGFYYRSIDPLYFVKKVYDHLSDVQSSWHPFHRKFVITDVRFKNEANYIREHGGILVRLNRTSNLNVYKGDVNDISETDLDDYTFDYVVDEKENVTIEDLKSVAEKLEAKYGSF